MAVVADAVASDAELVAGRMPVSSSDGGVAAEVGLLRRKARYQLAQLTATLAALMEVQDAVRRHQQSLGRSPVRV